MEPGVVVLVYPCCVLGIHWYVCRTGSVLGSEDPPSGNFYKKGLENKLTALSECIKQAISQCLPVVTNHWSSMTNLSRIYCFDPSHAYIIYLLQGPDYLWHIDGYDRLQPFGFPIHGCIDGQCFIIICECTTMQCKLGILDESCGYTSAQPIMTHMWLLDIIWNASRKWEASNNNKTITCM